MADERIGLVVEAQAKLEQLKAAITGVDSLSESAQKASRASSDLANRAGQADRRLRDVAGNARQTAGAITQVASAAAQGSGSMLSMANAVGQLSHEIGGLAKSAKVAAGATGIGALVTLGVTGVQIWKDWSAQIRAAQAFAAAGGQDIESLARRMHDLSRERERLQGLRVGEGPSVGTTDIEQRIKALDAEIAGVAGRFATLGGERSLHLAQQSAELERQARLMIEQAQYERVNLELQLRGYDTLTLQRREIDAQRLARTEEIRQRFIIRDAQRETVALTAEQQEMMTRLVGEANALAAMLKLQAERQQALRDATGRAEKFELRGGVDNEYEAAAMRIRANAETSAEDVETTELRIRKLRRETMNQAIADAGTLSRALIESGNKQLKAIGHFVDSFRRLMIGARAAEAAVESAKQFALVPAALAAGAPWAAALHAASGTQLAAAAALGFSEALGGGGGGRGGGSGGSAASAAAGATFEPRGGREGGGSTTIIIQTVNPVSREIIDQVRYELRAAEIHHRPVFSRDTRNLRIAPHVYSPDGILKATRG